MNNDYANMHIALEQLKAQGMDTRQLEAVVREQQSRSMNNSMTTTDGVYITQSTPDVPGVYIDEYQKQQDAYANQMQALAVNSQSNAPLNDMNSGVQPIVSPNYQVVQGPQRVTVGPRGELIYL